MHTKSILVACAVPALLIMAGCSVSVTPGQGSQAEWIGTRQKQQAAEQNRDRATALRVREALANDPGLAPLGLNVFVDQGHVRLCGHYPDQRMRARAAGLVEGVKGVASVDTYCGQPPTR